MPISLHHKSKSPLDMSSSLLTFQPSSFATWSIKGYSLLDVFMIIVLFKTTGGASFNGPCKGCVGGYFLDFFFFLISFYEFSSFSDFFYSVYEIVEIVDFGVFSFTLATVRDD